MKINNIYVKNIKAVDEFELPLNGCSVLLTGGNNRGKTTILRALVDRLRSEKPEIIVKINAQSEGCVELQLDDDSVFSWRIDAATGKEKLTYTTKSGVKTSSVKEIAKRYFPSLFDIDTFLHAAPREQSKMLQQLSGIDFTEYDAQYREAYEKRAVLKKHLESFEAALRPYSEELAAAQEPSQTKVLEKLELMLKTNAESETLRKNKYAIQQQIADYRRAILSLEEKEREIDASLVKNPQYTEAAIQATRNELAEIAELRNKIADAKKAQEESRICANYRAQIAQTEEALQQIRADKQSLLQKANLPSGITFDDEGVKVDGLPLSRQQLGTAKLYVTALKLAAKSLGEVKTLHFEASTLDRDTLKEVLMWANQEGLQLLIERADFYNGDIKYEILEA